MQKYHNIITIIRRKKKFTKINFYLLISIILEFNFTKILVVDLRLGTMNVKDDDYSGNVGLCGGEGRRGQVWTLNSFRTIYPYDKRLVA